MSDPRQRPSLLPAVPPPRPQVSSSQGSSSPRFPTWTHAFLVFVIGLMASGSGCVGCLAAVGRSDAQFLLVSSYIATWGMAVTCVGVVLGMIRLIIAVFRTSDRPPLPSVTAYRINRDRDTSVDDSGSVDVLIGIVCAPSGSNDGDSDDRGCADEDSADGDGADGDCDGGDSDGGDGGDGD
jgi:hypothetical protein